MDNFVYYIILFLLALIQCSIQEATLTAPIKIICGGANLNVRFPSGQMLGQQSGTTFFSYEPIDKYAHVDPTSCTITNGNMNILNGTSSSSSLDSIKSTNSEGNAKYIFTVCVNCSDKCNATDMLNLVDRLKDAKFNNLWVFLAPANEAVIQSMDLKNTNLKFAYLENDSFNKDYVPTRSNEPCSTPIGSESDPDALRSFSKTSVLFVSISFIILMVISLAWLVFYYVQRFRYAHAKDRLQRRLFNAAKKALTRIPTKPVKAGDKELDSDCPVCIDPYRAGDIVRMLPCRHVFHKTCVDPWLLEHRTCPMCKSDILKAFGYHVSMSGRRRTQFSAQIDDQHAGPHADSDHLSVDAQSTASESNAYPFPVVSEIHDPFSFTPATSPQLVQVMHATNARGFSIIPLTVHNGSGFASGSAGNFTTINASVERCPTTQSISNGQHNVTGDFPTNPNPNSNPGRALKSANSSRRPASRGHVVNLVHVRSRSLSHGNFAQASTSMTPPPVEQRPSALFRAAGRIDMPLRTVQTAGTITIEVAPNQVETRPTSKSKPSSPLPENSKNITSVAIEPDSEPFPLNAPQHRMAISQEDIPCGSRAESVASTVSGQRPITRGQSAKTVRSVPSAMSRKYVPPAEPMYAAFQILPPLEQRPRTAVIANAQNTAAVPLSDVISVESL